MKIKILFDENLCCDNCEIEIDEYKNVSSIRVVIYKILRENIKRKDGEHFHLIYQNILLNRNKLIKYYNLARNDEIWIGKLDRYLKSDDVIVELFIGGLVSSFMYLIVKETHSISHIKSIISKSISNIVKIWDINGNEMRDNQIIKDTDLIGGYYKLVVICYNEPSKTFIDWCMIHDYYFIWNYISTIGSAIHAHKLFPFYVNESKRKVLINKINDVKCNLLMNEKIEKKLNENLSNMPISFMNSRFLFCMDIADRIWSICEEYWINSIDKYAHGFHGFVRTVFQTELCDSLYNYATHRQNNEQIMNKSMMSVVVDAIDNLLNFLNGINEDCFCLTRLLRNFSLSICCNNENDKENIINSQNISGRFFKMRTAESDIELDIERENTTTINQLKTAISIQTNVPIQQVYIVYNSCDDTPNDLDNIDDIRNYFFEIVSSMENIQILKLLGEGGFGTVYLCQDKITNKFLALKRPKENCSDLKRDINIQTLLSFSENITRYSGLFLCEGETSMAIEYLSGGSLRSYLNEVEYLSEKVVAKMSHDILIQIGELHYRGIIHRDIKCDNVVLDSHNNPRIIDFGLSKFIEGIPLNELIELLNNKRKLYAPGTMHYMAPELIRSKPYSNKVDIWSFGMMVIEMITGRRPFHNLQPFQVVIKISRGENIDFNPPIPISDELKLFIDLCLKTNPGERPSAKELIESKFIVKYKNM